MATETPGEIHEEELSGEALQAGSAAAQAAAAALRALSRSARAFVLYDPTNEAIRRFLGEFRDKSQAALALCGELDLEVRPFELLFQGEVVYRETDRERSLAFRLFRDGVRKLTLRSGVSWEELLRLLEILSVRFAGVRQQEDDVVTLLTKASFQSIAFEAVEGFVAQNEDEGAGHEVTDGPVAAAAVPHVAAPPQFDFPLPAVDEKRPFAYRNMPERYLQALQAEESVSTLPAQAVRLAQALLACAADAPNRLPVEEVVSTLAEVRDFLVGERRLAPLLELVEALRAGPPAVAPVLEALGTAEVLPRLLEAIEGDAPPPELETLLQRVPGDHALHLVLRLSASTVHRKPILALLRPRLAEAADRVLPHLPSLPTEVLGDVASALVAVSPVHALQAARNLLETPQPEAQYQAAEVLSRLGPGDDVTAMVFRLLESPEEVTRIRGLQVLGRRKELRSFNLLTEWLNGRADRLSVAEADALGEALAQISQRTALSHLSSWLKPQGNLLRRLVETTGQKRRLRAAVTGLASLPLPEAEAALRDFKDRADEELRPHVVAALVRRRKEGRPGG